MPDANVLSTQITLGMLGAGVLKVLKSSKFVTAINDKSGVLNHIVLATTSAAGALGVHTAWNASTHSLTITGLTAAGIGTAVWLWAKQWAIQYLVHKGAFGAVSGGSAPVAGLAPYAAGDVVKPAPAQQGQAKP